MTWIKTNNIFFKNSENSYIPPQNIDVDGNLIIENSNTNDYINESVIYDVSNSNNVMLSMFKDWLTTKNINFIENKNELEILNIYDLGKEDQVKLLTYVTQSGIKKIYEEAIASSGLQTVANTIGIGYINPPKGNILGSGDKFNNPIIKKKKK